MLAKSAVWSPLAGGILGLLILGAGAAAPAKAQKKLPETEYDLNNRTITGERVKGPRRVIAKNLNTLRYDYRWTSTITYTAAPDLWSKLLAAGAAPSETPKAAPTGVSGAPKAVAPGTSRMDDCKRSQQGRPVGKLKQDLVELYCEAQLLVDDTNAKNDQIRSYKTRIETARGKLDGLLAQTQAAVQRVTLGGQELTQTLRGNSPVPAGISTDIDLVLRADSQFMTGVQARWLQNDKGIEDFAEARNLRVIAERLKKDIEDEKSAFPKFMAEQAAKIGAIQGTLQDKTKGLLASSDQHEAGKAFDDMAKALETAKNDLEQDSKLLDWAGQENDKILSAIPDLEETGQKYKAFADAREKLVFWKSRMENLKSRLAAKDDPFRSFIDEGCGFVFGGEKKNALTMTRVDLMPGGSSNPEQVLTLEIICSSPFTVSAGVAFSTVPQQEFAIRPVGGAPVNTFVQTSDSRFHPVPLGMVHARFYEPNEKLALHVAFGVAGNLRSQSAGGSDAEFLLGMSFSLFRTMFITPGLHLGRQVDLGPGFKVGDTVPSTITEPPLTKSYKPGFGLAITFTKP
jgi:hypothetical protein